MKSSILPKEQRIWDSIYGTKREIPGLPSGMTESLVDILGRQLGLYPMLVQYGPNDPVEFDLQIFLNEHIRDKKDGYCRLFYHPLECGEKTGTIGTNWLQWTTCLLNYKHQDSNWARKLYPPPALLKVLEAKGWVRSKKVVRFLTLELVVWYLAAQDRTWGNPGRIMTIKDKIESLGLPVIPVAPTSSGETIDVDDLFTVDPRVHVPKAGRDLVGYNPMEEKKTPNMDEEIQEVLSMGDLESPADSIEKEIAETEAKLDALKLQLQKKKEEEAIRVQMLALSGWIMEGVPDKDGHWASVVLAWPDGVRIKYVPERL